METLFSLTGIVLCSAAFVAGLVDAVVGGGGLIQIPALFAAFPNISAPTLLGTNKLSGVWGTAAAAIRYGRTVKFPWKVAAPGAIAAFAFAFVGAYTVTRVPSELLRKGLPVVLVLVGIYTYRKKDFGRVHAPSRQGAAEWGLALAVGSAIGFYDGFFGPGTGSFLIFLYIRFFGFDFLSASATSKIVNVACNVAALLWFGVSGHLIVWLGLTMAVFNVAGSVTGTRLALRYGSGFVRQLFLFVVGALVLKTAYDAFIR